jgi:hypothetical protein
VTPTSRPSRRRARSRRSLDVRPGAAGSRREVTHQRRREPETGTGAPRASDGRGGRVDDLLVVAAHARAAIAPEVVVRGLAHPELDRPRRRDEPRGGGDILPDVHGIALAAFVVVIEHSDGCRDVRACVRPRLGDRLEPRVPGQRRHGGGGRGDTGTRVVEQGQQRRLVGGREGLCGGIDGEGGEHEHGQHRGDDRRERQRQRASPLSRR